MFGAMMCPNHMPCGYCTLHGKQCDDVCKAKSAGVGIPVKRTPSYPLAEGFAKNTEETKASTP